MLDHHEAAVLRFWEEYRERPFEAAIKRRCLMIHSTSKNHVSKRGLNGATTERFEVLTPEWNTVSILI